ncbi:MAG: YibE/F family protein [Bacillota bacterium]|nr:YibE/F family protein [Bacillota bacterium]
MSFYLVSNNESYYSKTIAKIVSVTETEDKKTENDNGNIETFTNEKIQAVIMNGVHKGEKVNFQNTVSYSQTVDKDMSLKVNDEVFVSVNEGADKKIISAQFQDLKRDKYVAYIIILFVALILLIGGLKGLRSLISVLFNVIIFSVAIELFMHGYNLMLVASIASLLFIIVSISIVSGKNIKTLSAIIGTVAGTLFSILIAVIVIRITHSTGVHYEQMEFLTHPPEPIFFAEILMGTLGGIMDIAISISSAMNEIYDKNNAIERKSLIQSGMEIGKDIMGTMSNTLVFAYISGSIPIFLLWLKSGYSISNIIDVNISLEVMRALIGSIGIVLSIPITIFICVILLKKHRIGET